MTRAARGRALLLAACVGALAGCGDDDGVGIFSQQRDIAGTWVRVAPPGAAGSVNPASFRDTLMLRDDGSGRWSIENEFADVVPPIRNVMDVGLDGRGPVVFLNIAPCLVCFAGAVAPAASTAPAAALLVTDLPASPRFLSMVGPPHYRLRRTSAESLELEDLISSESRRYFYRRVSRTYPARSE